MCCIKLENLYHIIGLCYQESIMSKRRRETELVEKSGQLNETGIEEKRAKASSDAGEGKVGNSYD